MEKTEPTPPSTLDPDLLATIGMLFDVEHDMSAQYEYLGKVEKKLLYDIRACLEHLRGWIALSSPFAPPYASLESICVAVQDRGVNDVCEYYPSEIECWAEENPQRIEDVTHRALNWKFPD